MTNETTRDYRSNTGYAGRAERSDLDDIRGQVSDLSDTVQRKVRQNMGDVEQQIRDKPVQAALVAAGVGFLIGALLTR